MKPFLTVLACLPLFLLGLPAEAQRHGGGYGGGHAGGPGRGAYPGGQGGQGGYMTRGAYGAGSGAMTRGAYGARSGVTTRGGYDRAYGGRYARQSGGHYGGHWDNSYRPHPGGYWAHRGYGHGWYGYGGWPYYGAGLGLVLGWSYAPWFYDYPYIEEPPPAIVTPRQSDPDQCGTWEWNPGNATYTWIPCAADDAQPPDRPRRAIQAQVVDLPRSDEGATDVSR